MAGYVRTLEVVGNWLAAEGLGESPPDDALFLGRRGPLDARSVQQVVRRLKTRVGMAGRLTRAFAR